MFETIKKGISAVEKLADAMVQYAAAISEHADAVVNRKERKTEGETEKQSEQIKMSGRIFSVVCIETGEIIKSRLKYNIYRKIKVGLGGTTTRALRAGKTIKSKKTQLHYKAVKGF